MENKTIPSNIPEHVQFEQNLGEQANTVEQEARMVLPGIQTLFGFQLMVVFNQGFKANLNQDEQLIHLFALLLIAVSAVLVMAPAAYHRQANHQISVHFISLSSAFIAWAMLPLALGTCADIYIVSKVIIGSAEIAGVITFILGAIFTWTWFVLPHWHRQKVKNLPVHKEIK
ncbi:MAG: hypothetical protein H7235_07880 [Bdellovibrionaceae bacterium]|nr:hypothetical protein [Pseudobdellovibrionaceae bacterium]